MKPNPTPEVTFGCAIIIVVFGLFSGVTAIGQTTRVDVIIKEIDLASRTMSVIHNGKVSQLDLSRRTKVIIKGEPTELDKLIATDEATVEYHKDLAVVTSIEAKGLVTQRWKFYDVFGAGVKPEQVFIVNDEGRLVCMGQNKGYCFASQTPLSTYRFQVEFMQVGDRSSNQSPIVSVACRKPDPNSRDYYLQYPYGIEIKLTGSSAGEITLPGPGFKAQRPLDQLRRDRQISPIRKSEIKSQVWNRLDIAVDGKGSITVRINGKTVNALEEAETTTGHIVIFPNGNDIQFRSAALVFDGKEQPLPFTDIVNN
jgi:hypothetical protein